MTVSASGRGLTRSRLIVRTKASAIPLLCGLSRGVVLGSSPMSRAKLRVSVRPTRTKDVDPPIAVRRPVAGPTDPLLAPFLETVRKIGAGDADYLCHGLHREPSFGGDGGSRSCFFDPVACSRASLRISASSVFLPRSR